MVGELAALDLLDPRTVLETREHFIPNAYPVYAKDYARDALLVREALARVANLETLGRAGRFVYSHLHDQLRFGKDYVRELTALEEGALRVSSSGGPNALPRATFLELAGRAIAAAVRPRSDPADRAWAQSLLTPAEFDLWIRQSDYDQHHAIQVGRRVERRLASTAYAGDPLWTGAALMHDVGKSESNLSLPERVGRDAGEQGVRRRDRARRGPPPRPDGSGASAST